MSKSLSGAVGVSLLLIGALVLFGPTYGFSAVGADRSVVANTSEDPDALLGINDISEGETVDGPGDSPGELLALERNDPEIGSIQADVVAIDGQLEDDDIPLDTDVQSDDENEYTVVVACGDEEGLQNDEYDVTIGLETSGGTAINLDRTVSDVEINCQGPPQDPTGFEEVFASDVSDGTQTVTFTPQDRFDQGDTVEIRLSGVLGLVDYSQAEVDSVEPTRHDAEFINEGDEGTIEYTVSGNLREQATIEIINIGQPSVFGDIGVAEFEQGDDEDVDFFSVPPSGSASTNVESATTTTHDTEPEPTDTVTDLPEDFECEEYAPEEFDCEILES